MAPSPKSQAYEAIVPSASAEAEPFAVTETGAWPLDGVSVKLAVGAWLAAIVTVRVVEPVAPWLSVTVRVTV